MLTRFATFTLADAGQAAAVVEALIARWAAVTSVGYAAVLQRRPDRTGKSGKAGKTRGQISHGSDHAVWLDAPAFSAGAPLRPRRGMMSGWLRHRPFGQTGAAFCEGKPAERPGRKATGLRRACAMAAGLPMG